MLENEARRHCPLKETRCLLRT